eukprot:5073445-Heterocapsa_arctica.AAC.1
MEPARSWAAAGAAALLVSLSSCRAGLGLLRPGGLVSLWRRAAWRGAAACSRGVGPGLRSEVALAGRRRLP